MHLALNRWRIIVGHGPRDSSLLRGSVPLESRHVVGKVLGSLEWIQVFVFVTMALNNQWDLMPLDTNLQTWYVIHNAQRCIFDSSSRWWPGWYGLVGWEKAPSIFWLTRLSEAIDSVLPLLFINIAVVVYRSQSWSILADSSEATKENPHCGTYRPLYNKTLITQLLFVARGGGKR